MTRLCAGWSQDFKIGASQLWAGERGDKGGRSGHGCRTRTLQHATSLMLAIQYNTVFSVVTVQSGKDLSITTLETSY